MSTTPPNLNDVMPLMKLLGIDVQASSPEEVRARLAWAPELCTAGGVLHGGMIMTLADSTGALCAFLNLPEGATTSTVESKTNFFRPVTEGHVRVTAKPLHVGRRFVTVQSHLVDDAGKLVAQTTQTQAVITA